MRERIRTTWGLLCKKVEWCSYSFIVGYSDDTTSEDQINKEHLLHKDILKEPFIDTYNNLTLKSIYLLKHFVVQRLRLKFLLKVDDDSYVNILGLRKLLKTLQSNPKKGIFGFLQKGSKSSHWLPTVHRPTTNSLQDEQTRKWIVPKYMYRRRLFPQFLGGSGYLVERQDAQCLLSTSQIVSIIHLEDVYITGLCALNCHLRRIHHEGFKARKESIPKMTLSQFDVLIHYTNESVMQYLHDQTLQF